MEVSTARESESTSVLSKYRIYLLWILFLCTWAITHRYGGIWHDGVLYAGQALHHLDPTRFTNDLFFLHGSQDRFSIFSNGYALAIRLVGLGAASLVLMVIAQGLWIIATILITRAVLPKEAFWWGILAIAAVDRTYGSEAVFAYAETFVTARVFAEPLVLIGLYALVKGRYLGSFIALFIAASIHPIMAIPGIVTGLAYVLSAARLRALVIAGAAVLACIVAGSEWLPPLFRPMDMEWLTISKMRNPFIHLEHWKISEWMEPLSWSAMIYFAAQISDNPHKALWRAVIFSTGAGFALSLVATEWPIILLIQTQTWRTGWLLKVMGVLATAYIFRWAVQRQYIDRLFVALLVLCGTAFEDGGAIAAWVLALSYSRLRSSGHVEAWVHAHKSLTTLVVGLALVPALGLALLDMRYATSYLTQELTPSGISFRASLTDFDRSLLIIAIASCLMLLSFRAGKLAFGLAATVIACIAILSSLVWSRLPGLNSEDLLPFPPPPPELRAAVERATSVYADLPLAYIWFLLRTSSYASHHQAAGIVFSRQTALEASRRISSVELLQPGERLEWQSTPRQTSEHRPPNRQSLIRVCSDSKLGAILLRQAVLGYTADSEHPITLQAGRPRITLYLYDCERVRATPA